MKSGEVTFSSLVESVRIDKYLSDIFDYSRSHISKIIDNENVFINSKPTKSKYIIKRGDTVFVRLESPKSLNISPQNINIDIIYQDEDIAVINKPAGMVVHPSAGHFEGTLVNALLFHCDQLSGINDVIRPGIVHRLDKDTSGLMVIAKNDKAHLNLANDFKDRSISKFYKALVFNKVAPKKEIIKNVIGRHKKNRLKFSSFTDNGKIAITEYIVEKYYNNFTLVDINLKTGRTHQIRVHFSEKGNPLVGDTLYGSNNLQGKVSKGLRDIVKNFERVFLHSYSLQFKHPTTKEILKFNAPLPDELASFLKNIEDFDG